MIKKFAIVLSVIFFIATSAQQQSIKLGIGDNLGLRTVFTLEELTKDIFVNIFLATLGGNISNTSYHFSSPYVFVDYKYPVSEIVNVGGQVGYLSYTENVEYTDKYNLKSAFEYQNKYYVIMAGAEVRYFENDKIRMYGNYMAGITSMVRSGVITDKSIKFAFQLNPYGISYGKKIAAFAEVGAGYSIFTGGVKFSF